MSVIPGLRNICTPAYVYLVLSLITVFAFAVQNLGNPNSYCIGRYSCNVSSVSMLYVLKLLYIVFWTWILNILCKEGFAEISWFLVILPYVLMFIFITMVFLPN